MYMLNCSGNLPARPHMTRAEFRIYDHKGQPHLLPLNWSACQVMHYFDEAYRDYKPLRMTLEMIDHVMTGWGAGHFEVEIEQNFSY